MKIARLAFLATLTLPFMMTEATAQKTHVVMGTATPGGGFPLVRRRRGGDHQRDRPIACGRAAQHQGQRREHPAARGRQARYRSGGRRAGLRGLRGHRPPTDQSEDHHGDLFQPGHVRGERRQPGEIAARSGRQADRLGDARLRPDAVVALRARWPRPRPREGFHRGLPRACRRRAGDGGSTAASPRCGAAASAGRASPR